MFCLIILPHPEGSERGNKENRAVSEIWPEVAKSHIAEKEQIFRADARKNGELKDNSFCQNISKLKLQLITSSPFQEIKPGFALKWLNYS